MPSSSRNNVKPVVLFTEDGGQTWINRVAAIQDEFPFGEWGWKIQFLDELVGFISLENFVAGAILKTTDGGLTWERQSVNDQQGNVNLEGVGFTDEKRGWVGGWGKATARGASSETVDGGEMWQDANDIGRFINRFRFFGNPVTVGYASGRTVFKYSSEPVMPVPLALAQTTRILDTNEPVEASGPVEIVYTVPQGTGCLEIDIWDRFGRYVRRLVDEKNPDPGEQSITWDLKDGSVQRVPAGIYIYRITVDGQAESRVVWAKV